MHVLPVKTHRVGPDDTLEGFLDHYLDEVKDGDVVALTSKVLSILQGRLVPIDGVSRQDLIIQEADAYLAPTKSVTLTLKEGVLIPWAGIDESNAFGSYVLYPLDIPQAMERIWMHLKTKHQLKALGVILTDSRSTPLRRGTTGVCLGWCGFDPLYSYIGQQDLDGRPLQTTQSNLADGLAAAAVLAMGEGSEQTPLAILKDIPHITFLNRTPTPKERSQFQLSMDEDLYGSLLKSVPWTFKT